jgi:NAD(P)-dependent dehydrogenase (short-subunit alcohol dehydrogenase family)
MGCGNRFSDRVAVITGGSRGIGAAVARRLAAEGASIAMLARGVADLETMVGELRSMGRHAIGVPCNVASQDSVQDAFDRVLADLGRVDILVNSAAILGPIAPLLDLTPRDWDDVLAVNLTGTMFCCRAALPGMLSRQAGRIVNVSSVAGKEGNPNMSAYSVSKAGVICFTRSLAKEVARQGITVNCVSPATTNTEINRDMPPELKSQLLAKIPLGRIAEPEEVGAVIAFLASDEASFVTGQCYDVSGGRSVY